jgi:predicted acetyltransferase
MEIRIGTCSTLAELSEALAAIGHYFGMEQTEEGTEQFARNLELERMHVARDGERIVAGAGAFTFSTTVPGGAAVPTAGVTVVGVLPTHRRRGILRELMRAQLDDAHERGEPLGLLWASEATIYGRFGYGIASLAGDISMASERNAFAGSFAPRGRARIVEFEEALELVPPIYDRVRAQRPGMLTRAREWWEHRRLHDNPQWRRGGGPMNRVVLELDGEPQAYAIYRVHAAWENFVNTGSVRVIEALGATAEATAEIWRFLFDLDWIAKVEASLLPPDHPLFVLVAEPRRLSYRVQDALWCRLVDVGAALSARAYASDEPVVFEVADELCPWNAARWRVAGGRAEQTDESADLRLPVATLGSALLGGFTFRQLAEGARLEELKEGAVARADRVFGAWPLPWCPEIF